MNEWQGNIIIGISMLGASNIVTPYGATSVALLVVGIVFLWRGGRA